jgi:Ca2+-binding EF-hand superfamily protein
LPINIQEQARENMMMFDHNLQRPLLRNIDWFKEADTNNDGVIDKNEFKAITRKQAE